ncbi:MAG: MotA/TolQ/ExbB proton channel family protein [Campylobacterales bacterium]
MQGLAAYLSTASPITWLVFGVLSLYFIAILWIFIDRYRYLSKWLAREQAATEAFLMGSRNISESPALSGCIKRAGKLSRPVLDTCLQASAKESSVGLTILSIVSSTSPFVGLFGTVVSILDSFAKMGGQHVTMAVMAPAISEALIATAIGIFVAIWAYTFHLLLKRRAYEVMTYISMQINMILAHETSEL